MTKTKKHGFFQFHVFVNIWHKTKQLWNNMTENLQIPVCVGQISTESYEHTTGLQQK